MIPTTGYKLRALTLYNHTGSPGKTVTFDTLKSGLYTLLVIATADETGEEYRLTRSVYVPGDSDACVTTEINDGVSAYRGVVTAEFSTTGTFDSLACKLDGDALSSEQCMFTLTWIVHKPK